MIIGIPKEIRVAENRVAISTDVVKQMVKAGHSVKITSDAGYNAGQLNENLKLAGAEIVNDNADVFSTCEVIVQVNPPDTSQIELMREGTILISHLYAYT